MRNPEGQIRLYCKGADTILLERLHPGNQELYNVTTDHLNVSETQGRVGAHPGGGRSEASQGLSGAWRRNYLGIQGLPL